MSPFKYESGAIATIDLWTFALFALEGENATIRFDAALFPPPLPLVADWTV